MRELVKELRGHALWDLVRWVGEKVWLSVGGIGGVLALYAKLRPAHWPQIDIQWWLLVLLSSICMVLGVGAWKSKRGLAQSDQWRLQGSDETSAQVRSGEALVKDLPIASLPPSSSTPEPLEYNPMSSEPRLQTRAIPEPDAISDRELAFNIRLVAPSGSTYCGVTVELENTGLKTLEDCSIALERLDLYSPHQNDFTEDPFIPMLVMTGQTIRPNQRTSQQWLAKHFSVLPYIEIADRIREEHGGTWRAILSIRSGNRTRRETVYFSWQRGQHIASLADPRKKGINKPSRARSLETSTS